MAVKEFDEFVSRQQVGNADEEQVNWDQVRGEWLKHLDSLYSQIETLLGQYISSDKIQVRYKQVELNEENIGSYSARQMILRIGRQEVDLVPIGTQVFSFNGRVDIIGSAGKASIVLAAKDRKSTLTQLKFNVPLVNIPLNTPGPSYVDEAQVVHRAKNGLLVGEGKAEWVWKIMPRPPADNYPNSPKRVSSNSLWK